MFSCNGAVTVRDCAWCTCDGGFAGWCCCAGCIFPQLFPLGLVVHGEVSAMKPQALNLSLNAHLQPQTLNPKHLQPTPSPEADREANPGEMTDQEEAEAEEQEAGVALSP